MITRSRIGNCIVTLGAATLALTHHIGCMACIAGRVARRLVNFHLDRDEWFRAMAAYGHLSLPIVAATAAFVGMIMVVQGAVYVQQFGATSLVGWYTGFATFREVGPILVGLMFSGRVGASHCSELATMKVREQLDALRIMAIDVYETVIVPRILGMVVALTCLVIMADVVAILAGAVCARLLLGLSYHGFFASLIQGVTPMDMGMGVLKGSAFGMVIGVVSTHFGLTAEGGSVGVGRAVNNQVVACAVGMFCMDYALTMAFPG